MKVIKAVGGFPTPDNPQSGTFNEVAALSIAEHVDLTVVHFRYWKPGRKLISKTNKEAFQYICLSIPTWPLLHKKWTYFHVVSYRFFIAILLRNELHSTDIVHCVQGEIGVWFSTLKKKFQFKILTQFIGTDLVSEFKSHRNKAWIKGWEKNLDGASFNSEALKNIFNGYYPNFSSYAKVIYRGVELNKFKHTQSQILDCTNFLFLGGLSNYQIGEGVNLKGGVDLLIAWKQLTTKFPSLKVKLMFAGINTKESDIQRCFPEFSDLPKVEFLGPLNKPEVKIVFRNAHCTIIPSRQDGMPNVSLESQASGVAILGANIGGIPESIIHNKTGVLFTPGDTQQLMEQIESLAKNPRRVVQMGIDARQHVEAHFDSASFGINYLQFYNQLCAD